MKCLQWNRDYSYRNKEIPEQMKFLKPLTILLREMEHLQMLFLQEM